MRRIVAVQVRSGYRVWIRFADGVEGEVDLGDLVGKGVFSRWSDPAEFARVHVDPESHTIAWDGDVDLCPDTLYRDLTGGSGA
jgi:hypothetical protein